MPAQRHLSEYARRLQWYPPLDRLHSRAFRAAVRNERGYNSVSPPPAPMRSAEAFANSVSR